MIEIVVVKKSGNSIILPLSKKLIGELAISQGDIVTVKTTMRGFEVETNKPKKGQIQFPMSYQALISGAMPDCDLLPLGALDLE